MFWIHCFSIFLAVQVLKGIDNSNQKWQMEGRCTSYYYWGCLHCTCTKL